VTDLATAQQAIQTIIDQGEGTSKSPLEVVGNGYAHYYRYMQVQEGAKLIQLPNGQYSYTGAAIPFNPGGVYGVPTNPGPYPPGSKSAFANDNFNYAYTSLLKCLHAMFNGDATEARMNTALGLMMSLKGQAKAMMSGIPDPGTVTGPTFEYQPVNPPPR
jgi:Ferritin-like